MTALAYAQPAPGAAEVPASVVILSAILDYYGLDYFFTRTLRMINLSDDNYANAVDEVLETYMHEVGEPVFSLSRAFTEVLNDVVEEGYSKEEALEILAEEDYVVPVTVALYYSVDAGEMEIQRLSVLIRNRAKKMLRQLQDQTD